MLEHNQSSHHVLAANAGHHQPPPTSWSQHKPPGPNIRNTDKLLVWSQHLERTELIHSTTPWKQVGKLAKMLATSSTSQCHVSCSPLATCTTLPAVQHCTPAKGVAQEGQHHHIGLQPASLITSSTASAPESSHSVCPPNQGVQVKCGSSPPPPHPPASHHHAAGV